MPFIHVRLLEGRTPEQKKELGEALTRETVRVLGCPPEVVDVVFEDVKRSDWMTAGKSHAAAAPAKGVLQVPPAAPRR